MSLALRAAGVAVLAVAPVLASASPASADVQFQAQTLATAVHFSLTQEPASSIITASLVDDAAAYAAADFQTGGAIDAQSATVFPGNLVIQGPELFCTEVFTCPAQPPAYPLLADASYPRRSHDTATANQSSIGSGPFVVGPETASASATAGGSTSTTSTGSSELLGGTPAATSIGSAHAETVVTGSGSALQVHVASSASDISVAGLLHIGSVTSSDDIRLVAGRPVSDRPNIVVSGVTVAGVPASIDAGGIHVAGQDGPALGQKLTEHGITVRSIGATRSDGSGAARSDATGVEIDFSLPVSGTPYIPNPLPPPFDQVPGVDANGTYVGRLTLGSVGAAAALNLTPTFNLGGFGLAPVAGTPGTPGIPGTPGRAGVALPGSTGLTAPGQPPQVANGSPGLFRALLDSLSRRDGETIYLVIALGTVGMFLAWRGGVAWRRR
jgi:hypothetical protein